MMFHAICNVKNLILIFGAGVLACFMTSCGLVKSYATNTTFELHLGAGIDTNANEVIRIVYTEDVYRIVYNPNQIPDGWQPIFSTPDVDTATSVFTNICANIAATPYKYNGLATNSLYSPTVTNDVKRDFEAE